MLASVQWRGAARDLRHRAEAVPQGAIRAQLLALADYYDGLAEDLEQGHSVASPLGLTHP